MRAQVSPEVPFNTSSNIDLSQIDSNLKLSFNERLIQHQSALDLLLELDTARESLNAKSKQPA